MTADNKEAVEVLKQKLEQVKKEFAAQLQQAADAHAKYKQQIAERVKRYEASKKEKEAQNKC